MMFGLLWIHQNPFYSLLAEGKKKKKKYGKYYRKAFATWGCKLFILLTVLLGLNAGTGLYSTKVIINAKFACGSMVFIISLGSNIYLACMS